MITRWRKSWVATVANVMISSRKTIFLMNVKWNKCLKMRPFFSTFFYALWRTAKFLGRIAGFQMFDPHDQGTFMFHTKCTNSVLIHFFWYFKEKGLRLCPSLTARHKCNLINNKIQKVRCNKSNFLRTRLPYFKCGYRFS